MTRAKDFKKLAKEMTQWRRHLHSIPELAMQEKETSAYVEKQLQSFGVDEIHHIAGTGLVAVVRGNNAASGKSVMLRADMDALPLHEATGKEYASKNAGVMHACGHDGHMAMLLGAVKHIAATRDFDGTAYFIFQPAEERIGGAREMIREQLFEKFPTDAIYGLHNFPKIPLGLMGTGSGPFFAGIESFTITFTGAGGHSANPANTKDLISTAAETALAIKAASTTEIPAGETAIMSVSTMYTSSTAINVLSDTVTLAGTVRVFDPALRDKLMQKLRDIAKEKGEKFGVGFDVTFTESYPPLVNSAAETAFAAQVAAKTVGDACTIPHVPKVPNGEDFSFYLEKKPGNFIILGTGKDLPAPLRQIAGRVASNMLKKGKVPTAKKSKIADLHTAKYDFNDAALPIGAAYWVNLVETALAKNSTSPAPAAKPDTPKI